MSVKPRHYLPINKHCLVMKCIQSNALAPFEVQQFEQLSAKLERYFHLEFFNVAERLKEAYHPFDPDSDEELRNELHHGDKLVGHLESLLRRANYFKLSNEQVRASLEQSSLFKIRLDVDFDAFENVVVYCRGESERTEWVRKNLIFKREVNFINYDRVVLFLKLKPTVSVLEQEALLGRHGKTLLKMFKNVPQGDLEMLFPNTKIGMRLKDKLMIGIPAFISGAVVLATKMSATLVLLSGLIGFWLGYSAKPQHVDANTLLIMVTGFAALMGYFWKQFSSFKNRKLKFAQALTKNLYFKSLDNNTGVFYRVINDAQEQEFKETLMAYLVLLKVKKPTSIKALDKAVEQWVEAEFNIKLDFDITDALKKLHRLGLAEQVQDRWKACSVTQAVGRLDAHNKKAVFIS